MRPVYWKRRDPGGFIATLATPRWSFMGKLSTSGLMTVHFFVSHSEGEILMCYFDGWCMETPLRMSFRRFLVFFTSLLFYRFDFCRFGSSVASIFIVFLAETNLVIKYFTQHLVWWYLNLIETLFVCSSVSSPNRSSPNHFFKNKHGLYSIFKFTWHWHKLLLVEWNFCFSNFAHILLCKLFLMCLQKLGMLERDRHSIKLAV